MASRLPSDFRRLLRLGPTLVFATAAFLVGLGGIFVDNSELMSTDLLRVGGLVVGGLGVAVGLAALTAWLMLHQRLSGAEMRASESVG